MSNNTRAEEYGFSATKALADYINGLKSEDFDEMKDWYEKGNNDSGCTTFAEFLRAMDRSLAGKKSKGQGLNLTMEEYIDEMMAVYSGVPLGTVRVLQKS